MRTLLDAARRIVKAAGNRFYIQANIDTGPFSLAAVLRGTQSFLMDVATGEDRDIGELLEFCTEVVISYGKAMIATGVHGIQFGDATAGLVSPADFARHVVPWQGRALRALAGTGGDLWVHICGKTDHILPLMRHLPFQGFEVDAKVDMNVARKLLGERISLKGNLDTVFLLQRTPEEVIREVPKHPAKRARDGCGSLSRPRRAPHDAAGEPARHGPRGRGPRRTAHRVIGGRSKRSR